MLRIRTAARQLLHHWRAPTLALLLVWAAVRFCGEPAWLAIPCAALVACGFLSNVAVILLNDGRMPAALDENEIPEELRDRYQPITGQTRLPLLADRFRVGSWLVSLGDLLMGLAFLLSIVGPLTIDHR